MKWKGKAPLALLLPLLILAVLVVPTGLLLSAWASSAQEPAAPAWRDNEYQLFEFVSEGQLRNVPESERKLLTLTPDGKLRVDPGSEQGA
jgi:hypothetical protein